jgi:hypothetical protein
LVVRHRALAKKSIEKLAVDDPVARSAAILSVGLKIMFININAVFLVHFDSPMELGLTGFYPIKILSTQRNQEVERHLNEFFGRAAGFHRLEHLLTVVLKIALGIAEEEFLAIAEIEIADAVTMPTQHFTSKLHRMLRAYSGNIQATARLQHTAELRQGS